jgi:hypothetical protein
VVEGLGFAVEGSGFRVKGFMGKGPGVGVR